MVREDLITSAVSFLQDPSVASAPLEKRIAFLQSKNLTQEEVELSLARAAEDPSQPPPPPSSSAPSNYTYRSSQSAPTYGGYSSQGYWQPPPPPEYEMVLVETNGDINVLNRPLKRDWRDYFIMATVMGGVGYGLYFTAKQYILPLVQPPTQPQLEQDKASIDESFKRAFDLLEQLSTDTTALKASEEARTTRLDHALGDLESVLVSLKESSKRQGDDNRRIEADVRGLRDLIPKALDAQKKSTDNRLRELSTELKSLKTLIGNRMGSAPAYPATTPQNFYGQTQAAASTHAVHGVSGTSATPQVNTQPNGNLAPTSISSTERPASPSYGRGGGERKIPAWQMAAQKKGEEIKKDTSESGTMVDASASS